MSDSRFPPERAYDLLRYARHYLADEGLISQDELHALILAPSSSARRLESYDEMRRTIAALEHDIKNSAGLGDVLQHFSTPSLHPINTETLGQDAFFVHSLLTDQRAKLAEQATEIAALREVVREVERNIHTCRIGVGVADSDTCHLPMWDRLRDMPAYRRALEANS